MNARTISKDVGGVAGLLLMVCWAGWRWAEPPAAAVAGFDSYVEAVEARLAGQHRSAGWVSWQARLGARRASAAAAGRVGGRADDAAGGAELPGAMLHHWRGTAFAPGATAADFERLMRDFGGLSAAFCAAGAAGEGGGAAMGDHVQAWMRVRQKHVITVVMDTTYDVTFGRLDAQHGFSISRSTRIAEIDAAGTGAGAGAGCRAKSTGFCGG